MTLSLFSAMEPSPPAAQPKYQPSPPSAVRRTRLGVESEAAGGSRWRSRGSRRRSPAAPLYPKGGRVTTSPTPPASHHRRHRCRILLNQPGTPSASYVPRPATQTRHLSRLSPSHTCIPSHQLVFCPCQSTFVISLYASPRLFLTSFLSPPSSPPFSFARTSTGLSFVLILDCY